jgi:hypothetical protein
MHFVCVASTHTRHPPNNTHTHDSNDTYYSHVFIFLSHIFSSFCGANHNHAIRGWRLYGGTNQNNHKVQVRPCPHHSQDVLIYCPFTTLYLCRFLFQCSKAKEPKELGTLDLVSVKVRSPLCFFVPGTNSKQWRYALALENVQDNAKHAPVLLQNGKIRSFSRRNIESASRRMTDTSKQANKAWETPVYIQQFTPAMIESLDEKWTQLFTLTPDELTVILRGADDVFKSRKGAQTKVSGKPTRSPEAPKPKQVKSKWKINTQVATNKPVLPGGVASPTTTHSVPGIIWVRGLISKFHGDSACPYEITWDTQPEPIMHRKNAVEVTDLVANFSHCLKFQLLQGYVGLDLLWQKDASKASSSASSPEQTTKPSLQYGLVRQFDPLMDKYNILFRTGIWSWKTEEDVKGAHQFTDMVITGQHGSWSFDDAQAAAQESSTILESQQDQTSPTNEGNAQDSSQSEDAIVALTATEVSAILFPKKPTRVLPARVSKQANVNPLLKHGSAAKQRWLR